MSSSDSKLENLSSEIYKVFQSYPGGQNEVVRMLFSFMLQHNSGCQHDGTKTLMKEVQTQTESCEVSPLEPSNNSKKKRRRRRKKRKSKNTNESSTEVDHSVDLTSSNCANASADIPHQNPDNIALIKTEASVGEDRGQSYRSELLAKQYRSRYSRSSSSTSSASSVPVSRSRSRSRRSSPSFHESRRITSARRLPVSYCRKSPRRGKEKKRRRRPSSTESSRSRSSGQRERCELVGNRCRNRGIKENNI